MPGEGYAAAMEGALVERVHGSTLSERVQCALNKSFGVRALSEVCAEVKALDAALGRQFWFLVSRYLNGITADDEAKVALVQAIKALEPPRPAPVESSWQDIVPGVRDAAA